MAKAIAFGTWKAELQGLHGFLVNLGDKADASKHSMQVVARLRLVSGLTADQASEAVSLISSGPWPEAQKTQLTQAVSDALLSNSSSPKRRPGQVVKSFAGFFSEKDIDILAGISSLAVKIDCILEGERLARFLANLLIEVYSRHIDVI